MNELQFAGDDPGAVTLGNFINYYEFHPPSNRMQYFPRDIWEPKGSKALLCLDIGCNTGDLTKHVYESVSESITQVDVGAKCFVLGIDIDPILICRAEENNTNKDQISYQCLDFMHSDRNTVLQQYLSKHGKERFDVVFCFSVTMWIHLNHGDEGLRSFIKDVCEIANLIVIEPQPWKCYRSAVKRLKRCQRSFPLFDKLSMRLTVDKDIEEFLQKVGSFKKVHETPESSWGRRTVFYAREN